MSDMLCERVRGVLKSNSVTSLKSEYQSLDSILLSKSQIECTVLIDRVYNRVLKRNAAAEHYIPQYFFNVNKNSIALR